MSERYKLSLTGIKANPMSLSKFFTNGKRLSEGIWGWSKNGWVRHLGMEQEWLGQASGDRARMVGSGI